MIAEQGTHDELMAINGIYHKLVSKQLERNANQLDEAGAVGHGDSVDDLLGAGPADDGDDGKPREQGKAAKKGRSDGHGIDGGLNKGRVGLGGGGGGGRR
jgi:hypothetical protein